MKIIERIKNIRNIKNINELARMAQKKIVVLILVFVGVLIFIGWAFMPSKSSKGIKIIGNAEQQVVKLDGVTNSQFSKASSQKALEEQHREIRDLHVQLKNVNDQMVVLQQVLNEIKENDNNNGLRTTQELQERIDGIENILGRKHSNSSNIDPANGKVFTLEELQRIVKGYVELVPITNGEHSGRVMVVDEEGKLKADAQLNKEASRIAGQQIVGSVIIIDRDQIE